MNTLLKKLGVATLALALVVTVAAPAASAQTVVCSFTRDLTIGSRGTDVTCLQSYLQARGFFTYAGGPTGYFGPITRDAVARWQAANSVYPTAGYFGPLSRGKYISLIVSTPTQPTNPTTPNNPDDDDLEGGAGSIDSFELISSLNNEEVGEDEEDAEVAGIEIEVDDGSDIELTAVRLNFDPGTANDDFEDYADEVSLWLDGEEVARADADEWDDDNDYERTISLDHGAIIRRGDVGELTVAITGGNLDSDNEGDTWTVDFESVRYRDADGATISEGPTTGARTFSFESFSTAADVGIRITEDEDEINEAHTIAVDTNDDTEDAEVLSFIMEIEGDSDITLDSLPINFDVTGAADVDDVINGVHLYVDGDEVGNENLGSGVGTDETVVFDDIDLTLEAGEEYEFLVTVDINPTDGDLDEGDTISASIGETETNSADFDAEDESGDNVEDNDIRGSATGGPHGLFATGITVSFVSATEVVNTSDGADNDSGTFRIEFEVEAVGGTVYVSDTATATTDSSIADSVTSDDGIFYRLMADSTATTEDLSDLVTFTRGDGASQMGNGNIELDEGETTQMTLTVVRSNDGDADDDGIFYLVLEGIGWNSDNSDTVYNVYDFDLEDYRTDPITLN